MNRLVIFAIFGCALAAPASYDFPPQPTNIETSFESQKIPQSPSSSIPAPSQHSQLKSPYGTPLLPPHPLPVPIKFANETPKPAPLLPSSPSISPKPSPSKPYFSPSLPLTISSSLSIPSYEAPSSPPKTSYDAPSPNLPIPSSPKISDEASALPPPQFIPQKPSYETKPAPTQSIPKPSYEAQPLPILTPTALKLSYDAPPSNLPLPTLPKPSYEAPSVSSQSLSKPSYESPPHSPQTQPKLSYGDPPSPKPSFEAPSPSTQSPPKISYEAAPTQSHNVPPPSSPKSLYRAPPPLSSYQPKSIYDAPPSKRSYGALPSTVVPQQSPTYGNVGENNCVDEQVLNVDGKCVTPIETQNLFVYNAPPLPISFDVPPQAPPPKIDYNIVFVKTPEQSKGQEPIVVPPPQQKTIVYVLNKNGKLQGQRVIEIPAGQKLNPDVYYINYNDGNNPKLPGGLSLQQALSSVSTQQGKALEGGVKSENGFGAGVSHSYGSKPVAVSGECKACESSAPSSKY